MPTDLLPPNATPLEQALAQVSDRVAEIPLPIEQLWNPATCPAPILPWMAWGLSVDNWDSSWSEALKREAIAQSIEIHRAKGTPASVETLLSRFDDLLTLQEWHEFDPPRDPHTFEVTLELVQPDGSTGGARTTAAFAERIIAEVSRVKPLREHLVMVQRLAVEGVIGLAGAARFTGFVRQVHVAAVDDSQPWDLLLQTENGEPLEADDGSFLEHT